MKIQIFAGAFALTTGACAYEPTPLPDVTVQQAVTNTALSSPIRYRDPLAGYTTAAPRHWRTVNKEQSEGN